MNQKNNGGPAFPGEQRHPGEVYDQHFGMSLREYFAAKAPAEIPAWFQYAMPKPRPVAPFKHKELTDEQQKQLEGLGDWLEETQVDLAVVAFARNREKVCEEQKVWDLAEQSGRFFAWRWHYADMMLATGSMA